MRGFVVHMRGCGVVHGCTDEREYVPFQLQIAELFKKEYLKLEQNDE